MQLPGDFCGQRGPTTARRATGATPRRAQRWGTGARWLAATAVLAAVFAAHLCAALQQPQDASQAQTVVLDRVVAVVDQTAILASDVDEEMRFAALQPGAVPASDNTPERALDRLIDRALIDEQRVLQPGLVEVSPGEVDQALASLRQQIPGCAAAHCNTPARWKAFLAANHLTEQEVEQRVRERLAILKFIDLRFGAAVRVSNADVRQYYDQTLRPELNRRGLAAPDLKSVAPKIREVLRQQRISTMMDQWLSTLRGQGDVRILDPNYTSGGNGQ